MTIIVNGSNTPTAGAVGYGDGTNLAFTSAGTTGQFLSSNGSSAPSWVGAPASAMTLISTKSISSATSFNFTGLSGYNYYQLIFTASSFSANDYLVLQFGYGSTPTYITSGYGYGISRTNAATTQANTFSTAASYITLQYPLAYPGPITSNLFINTALSTSPSYITVNGIAQTSIEFVTMVEGNLQPSSTITALQVYMLGGNTFSGTASLYGISS